MSQTPYAAVFTNDLAAEAAAKVRNALMIAISGRDAQVNLVHDWYRRDEEGRPMPAEWRELVGLPQMLWDAEGPPTRVKAGSPKAHPS